MPRSKSVPAIFEEFVGSLSALIREKVAESVNAATTDFLTAKFGHATEEPKPGESVDASSGRSWVSTASAWDGHRKSVGWGDRGRERFKRRQRSRRRSRKEYIKSECQLASTCSGCKPSVN